MADEPRLTAPQVIRPADRTHETAQSAGAQRIAGVSMGNTGASRVWLGRVMNEPGHRSVPHHHGEAETAGFVLEGRARIYFGEGYRDFVDLEAGDFVFVPAYLPHIEANMSSSDELVFLTARSPDNIVVNLDAEPGYP
jgi:uncharacterized RmlC-like cupin family protein